MIELPDNYVFNFRKAVGKDCNLLYDWVNDESVRSNSINNEIIEWEGHQKWFTSKITNSATKIYILEYNTIPVGQIRIEKELINWIISYSIDNNYRGKGLGKKIVQLLLFKHPNFKFTAIVKNENISSIKIFKTLGFKIDQKSDDFITKFYYSKAI